MSTPRRTYFLSPSWDITPEEVELGSVIADIRTPHHPLNSTSFSEQIDTHKYTQRAPASGYIETSRGWAVGVFATFMQNITFGSNLSCSRDSSSKTEYSIEAITTSRFTPSPSYLEKVASNRDIQNYLKISGLGAKVFVVTGIKTATSVSITTSDETRNENEVSFGVEVPVAQVNAGPKATFSKKSSNSHTTHIDGPIVFAFQVLKVRVSRKGEVKAKEHVHGAVLGIGGTIDYVFLEDGDSLDDDELDDYDLVRTRGSEEETSDECSIICDTEQAEMP